MIEQFKKVVEKFPYKPHAIFPSEMFMFYKLAYDFDKYDHIIESGSGLSTLYLASLFQGVKITSIDLNINFLFKIKAKGVEKIRGNSRTLLPKILMETDANRIAVLIDGPKHEEALALTKYAVQDKRVVFVAVHDLSQREAEEGIYNTRYEPTFRANYGFLDDNVGEYLKHYPNGPGLTIFSERKLVI